MAEVLRVCATCGKIGCTDHQRKAWQTSRRRQGVASGWEQQRQAKKVMKLYNGCCYLCGRPGAEEVDHLLPISQGGEDRIENKRPVHRLCHRTKTEAESRAARRAG